MLMKAKKYRRNRFSNTAHIYMRYVGPWASCQIRQIAGAHAPGMPGTFSPPPRISNTDMHHGTCVTHVSWCMPGSLTPGFLWIRPGGKRSRHSRRMRNPQFSYLVRGPYKKRKFLYSVNGAKSSAATWYRLIKLNMPVFLPPPLAIIISNRMKLAGEISRNIAAIRVLNTDIGYAVGSLFPIPATTIVITPVII